MNTSEPKQPDTEVVVAAREQWQRPTFKKTDAKDAEGSSGSGGDLGAFS